MIAARGVLRKARELPVILIADDDRDDRLMIQRALEHSRLRNPMETVGDGEELMDYLREQRRPALVLLDLDMPRKSGREALREVKTDPDLRSLPIIVLTTSELDEDVTESYDVGANAYITKPVTFDKLVQAMNSLQEFWFELVRLPESPGSGARGDDQRQAFFQTGDN